MRLQRSLAVAPLLAALSLFASYSFPTAASAQVAWKQVKVPDVWKRPPGEIESKGGGYGWYRCAIKAPANWEGRPLKLFAESADDARQYYVNGVMVGEAGHFPPTFRSGLGEYHRFPVDPLHLRPGKTNVIAVRVFQKQARTNFNVAPPVLFAGEEAIRMAGTWEFHVGDLPAKQVVVATKLATLGKIEATSVVEETLTKIQGDAGPLTIPQALAGFQTPKDLIVEVAAAEPDVRQPLSFKWDERGRMWVVQYLQYPNPAGLKMVSRDKYLRTVWDKTPAPPPNHFPGADKISIHEDTDGDGVYDKHKSFVEGLSLVSSFAIGRDGVWVLNPPYLLFYPDKDHDDKPDGDPQVVLQGFGLEDSHSVSNSLRWGPDGWLYATQGSTVTGQIRRPDEDQKKAVHSMGQLVWRYHPASRRYEIFAEGGGNAFGVEIDAKGRIYSGHNGGNTRGFHYVQGGYYRKGFGKHGELSNPFTFGYFANMAHHNVPRFTHTFVIYEGGSLPATYHGKLFGVAPLLSHVVYSDFQPDRSSFKTKDLGHPMTTKDNWFRPVDIQSGPDGSIYVADFYEQRIDHSSHYQGRIHRQSGRIYRLRSPQGKPDWNAFDMGEFSNRQLVKELASPNKWRRQTALRLIGDRRDASLIEPLKKQIRSSNGQLALEQLWALNLSGGFDDTFAAEALEHAEPHVRVWTVRLLCDEARVSPAMAKQLADVAYREPEVVVRSQLASSARRLPAEQGLPIVANLLRRSEDAADIHVPLLLWWAIEDKADSNAKEILSLLEEDEAWALPLVREHLVERLMRRFALSGKRRDLLACAELFRLAPTKQDAQRLMTGFEQAFQGRSLLDLPDQLVSALTKAGGGSLALRIRQGDKQAIAAALKVLSDKRAKASDRILYIETFGQTKQPASVEPLLQLVSDTQEPIRLAAIYALQAFDSDRIAEHILQQIIGLKGETQRAAFGLMASRPAWTSKLLTAIDSDKLAEDKVPLAIVRRMLLHDDEKIRERIGNRWGNVQGAATEEMKREIERIAAVVAAASGNPYNGKKLYRESCGKCHVLFTDGGKVGPNLTTYKRDDFQGMLVNVVNPSLEIREGFENYAAFLLDGRTLNGFIEEQDTQVVVLKGVDGQKTIVKRDDIDELLAIPRSIMPEGLLKDYTEQQLRDLFAYLRATQPLP